MEPRNFEAISVLISVLDEDGKENSIEITNHIFLKRKMMTMKRNLLMDLKNKNLQKK